MSEPIDDDELHQALRHGAEGFAPTGNLGATRSQVVGRVRRRQRRVLALGVVAALSVSAGVIALAANRSGSGRSEQVAARGADPGRPDSAITTTVAEGGEPSPGPAGGPVATPSTAVASSATATAGSTGPPISARPSSTTLPTATTTTPPTTVPATVPVTTILPAASEVRGTVLFGPTCPVESYPPVPACAPRPDPAHIQLVRADGTVAAQGDAGSNGSFAIPVAPGTYTVMAATVGTTPSIGRGCASNPTQVTVRPGAASTVAVSCDTGIR